MASPVFLAPQPPDARRELGGVSTVTMGCGRLGAFWQGRGVREGRLALETAIELGITSFDTADVYSRGLSERILGVVARRRRSDLFVATKIGQIKSPRAVVTAMRAPTGGRARYCRGLGPTSSRGGAEVPRCWDARYVEVALRRSLQRLRSDYVDLLLLHGPSPAEISSRSLADTLRGLMSAGLVRRLGVSCDSIAAAQMAIAQPWVSAIEVPLSLHHREAATRVIPSAASRGISVFARSPFASGQLLRGASPPLPSATARTSHDWTAACLRYVIDTPGVASVVVGLSNPGHVHRAVRAAAAGVS